MATMLQVMVKPKKKKVEVMDTELRTNVPVKQVKKETQSFVDAMEDARKKTEAEVVNKSKTNIGQKYGSLPDKTMKVLVSKKKD